MTVRARHAVLLIVLVLVGCQPYGGRVQATPAGYRLDDPSVPPSPFAGRRWKAILLAGDSSAPVFDNATRDLSRLLERRGVQVVATFTADRAKLSPTVQFATHEELRKLPTRASVSAGEGCLFFATSHGTPHGLRLPQDPSASILSPETLKQIIASACGDVPTVIVVSACHSGTFIRESTVGPNVIILTAASDIRRSFGCRAERRYTYYDGCLLTEFPQAGTWQELHARVLTCIQTKEASLRELPSDPQAFFGRNMKDLPLPRAR
jgi:peptidase C13-like protein